MSQSGVPASDRAFWQRAGGVWVSHWVTRDASGAIVDEFDARLDGLIDLDAGRLRQRNRYTRADGSVEERRFDGGWTDGQLVLPAGPRTGRLRVIDERTSLLHFSTADGSSESFEMTVFAAPDRRARSNMQVEDGRIVRTTVMYDERRLDVPLEVSWDD